MIFREHLWRYVVPVLASGWRRIAAWAVDAAGALTWAGVLAAGAWPQQDHPTLARLAHGGPAADAVGFIVLIAPVTAALSWAEHRWGRTPGKALMGLHVMSRTGGRAPSLTQALTRNALKVALPWSIGHAAVFALVDSGRTLLPPPTWAAWVTGLSYVLPLTYLVALFTRTGRTPYDMISGTRVCGESARLT